MVKLESYPSLEMLLRRILTHAEWNVEACNIDAHSSPIACSKRLLFGGRMEHITGSAIAILLYLSFVSAAAYSLWSLLLKYNPVSKVAVFGFLNPICGVCISTIFLKEKDAFHIFTIPALIFVCVGIYIVNHKKQNA